MKSQIGTIVLFIFFALTNPVSGSDDFEVDSDIKERAEALKAKMYSGRLDSKEFETFLEEIDVETLSAGTLHYMMRKVEILQFGTPSLQSQYSRHAWKKGEELGRSDGVERRIFGAELVAFADDWAVWANYHDPDGFSYDAFESQSRVIRHPGFLPALMSANTVMKGVINGYSELLTKDEITPTQKKEILADLETVAGVFSGRDLAQVSLSESEWVVSVIMALGLSGLKEAEPLRKELVKKGEELLRVKRPMVGNSDASPGISETYYIHLEEFLKSPVAKGEFLDHPAPPLPILWTRHWGVEDDESGSEEIGSLDHELFRGKVVVLDFFTEHCLPCFEAMPKTNALYDYFQERGSDVVFLGVYSDRRSRDPRVPLMLENSVPFEEDGTKNLEDQIYFLNGVLEQGWLSQGRFRPAFRLAITEVPTTLLGYRFGFTGVPHVVILDQEGAVAYSGLHPKTDHEKIKDLIKGLLY